MRNRTLVSAALFFLVLGMVCRSGETIRVLLAQNTWTDAVKALTPEFEKSAGIRVKMETFEESQLSRKLAAELEAGTDIDVFVTRPLNEGRLFEQKGWYLDLTPFVEKDAEYDFDDFTRASREATRINGTQICVPTSNECHVLFYRKDIFEALGLKPPATMRDLRETAEKLTNRDEGRCGVLLRGRQGSLITQFSSFLYSFGGDWYDRDTGQSLFFSPEAVNAITFYGSLLRECGPDGVDRMNWPQLLALFQEGKGAMYLDASAHYPMLVDLWGENLADKTGVALFPEGPDGRKPYSVTAMGMAIFSGSEKKDSAWRFIRFMTDKQRTVFIQGEYAYPTARQSAYAAPEGVRKFPEDFIRVVAETERYAVGSDRPDVAAVDQARDILGAAVVTAITGGDHFRAARMANGKFQDLLTAEK